MADLNPALRAELLAALAVIAPQIRGLQALLKFPISPSAAEAVNTAIDQRAQRRGWIENVIAALDRAAAAALALEADGYPALASLPVLTAVEQEIQQEVVDLKSAVAAFSDAFAQ